MDLDVLDTLESVEPQAGRQPSEWLLACYRKGFLKWEEAQTLYLCLVPCQRIGRGV